MGLGVAFWQKRIVTLAVTLCVYVLATFVLAIVVSYLDRMTTGPMTVADAWIILAILMAGLPIGSCLVAEVVWFERRRRSRSSAGLGGLVATPAPSGVGS